MVGTIVGRKKKDADRVNYNISRNIRAAVLNAADKMNWNEIDAIEDLLWHGLTARAMLKSGDINYAGFSKVLDSLVTDANAVVESRKTDDSEPLPESRGGKRSGAGRPKAPTEDMTIGGRPGIPIEPTES